MFDTFYVRHSFAVFAAKFFGLGIAAAIFIVPLAYWLTAIIGQ